MLSGAGPALFGLDIRGTRGAKYGATTLEDMRDGFWAEPLEIAAHETVKAVADTQAADADGCARTDDGTNRRVHAGRVSPAGENSDLSHSRLLVSL